MSDSLEDPSPKPVMRETASTKKTLALEAGPGANNDDEVLTISDAVFNDLTKRVSEMLCNDLQQDKTIDLFMAIINTAEGQKIARNLNGKAQSSSQAKEAVAELKYKAEFEVPFDQSVTDNILKAIGYNGNVKFPFKNFSSLQEEGIYSPYILYHYLTMIVPGLDTLGKEQQNQSAKTSEQRNPSAVTANDAKGVEAAEAARAEGNDDASGFGAESSPGVSSFGAEPSSGVSSFGAEPSSGVANGLLSSPSSSDNDKKRAFAEVVTGQDMGKQNEAIDKYIKDINDMPVEEFFKFVNEKMKHTQEVRGLLELLEPARLPPSVKKIGDIQTAYGSKDVFTALRKIVGELINKRIPAAMLLNSDPKKSGGRKTRSRKNRSRSRRR